jgi:hypothetical protein
MKEKALQRKYEILFIEFMDLAKRQFSLEEEFIFVDYQYQYQSQKSFYIFKHKQPFATLNITSSTEFVNAVTPLLVFPEIRNFLAFEIFQYGLTNNFILPNKEKHFSLRTELAELETTIQEYKALPSLGIFSLSSKKTKNSIFSQPSDLNLWLSKLHTFTHRRETLTHETLNECSSIKVCQAYVLWLAQEQNLGVISAQLFANACGLNVKVHSLDPYNVLPLESKNKTNNTPQINLLFYNNQMTLLYENTLTYLPLLWTIARSRYTLDQSKIQIPHRMKELNHIIKKVNVDYFSSLTDKIIRRVIDYIIPNQDIERKATYKNLSNFGRTNKRLSEITKNQELWKMLFLMFIDKVYGYEFTNKENVLSLSNTTNESIKGLLRDELTQNQITAITYANKSKIYELNAYFPMRASICFFEEEQKSNRSNDNSQQIIEHVILAINNGNLSAWFLLYEICKAKKDDKNINDVVRIIQTTTDTLSQNNKNIFWEYFIACESYKILLQKIKNNCIGILCNQFVGKHPAHNKMAESIYSIADFHFENWNFLQRNFRKIKSFFIYLCQMRGDMELSEKAISYLINSFNPYLIVNELSFSDINMLAQTTHGEVIINFLSSITNHQQRKLAMDEYLTLGRQGYFIKDDTSQLFDIQRLNAILKSDNRTLLLKFSTYQLHLLKDILINFYNITAKAFLQKFTPPEIVSIFKSPDFFFHTDVHSDDGSFAKSKLLTLNITTPLLELFNVETLQKLSTFDLVSLIIDDQLQIFIKTYPYFLNNFHKFDREKLRLRNNYIAIPYNDINCGVYALSHKDIILTTMAPELFNFFRQHPMLFINLPLSAFINVMSEDFLLKITATTKDISLIENIKPKIWEALKSEEDITRIFEISKCKIAILDAAKNGMEQWQPDDIRKFLLDEYPKYDSFRLQRIPELLEVTSSLSELNNLIKQPLIGDIINCRYYFLLKSRFSIDKILGAKKLNISTPFLYYRDSKAIGYSSNLLKAFFYAGTEKLWQEIINSSTSLQHMQSIINDDNTILRLLAVNPNKLQNLFAFLSLKQIRILRDIKLNDQAVLDCLLSMTKNDLKLLLSSFTFEEINNAAYDTDAQTLLQCAMLFPNGRYSSLKEDPSRLITTLKWPKRSQKQDAEAAATGFLINDNETLSTSSLCEPPTLLQFISGNQFVKELINFMLTHTNWNIYYVIEIINDSLLPSITENLKLDPKLFFDVDQPFNSDTIHNRIMYLNTLSKQMITENQNTLQWLFDPQNSVATKIVLKNIVLLEDNQFRQIISSAPKDHPAFKVLSILDISHLYENKISTKTNKSILEILLAPETSAEFNNLITTFSSNKKDGFFDKCLDQNIVGILQMLTVQQNYRQSFNSDKTPSLVNMFFTGHNVDDRATKRKKHSDEANVSVQLKHF